jgi:hypothetical protein
MRKLTLLLASLLLFGCKTPCSDPGSVASIFANMAINDWQCTNPQQVLADISSAAEKYGLCQANAIPKKQIKGVIATVICPIVIGELQSLAAGAVPKDWGCNPGLVGPNFAAALTTLCASLPF